MIFSPELIEKVMAGNKTVTRRRLPVRYQEGKVYAVQPGRGKRHVGHIEVTSMDKEPLLTVTRQGEPRKEGFGNYGYFFGYWRELHGYVDYQETVARIAFRLAPPCPDCVGEPIT